MFWEVAAHSVYDMFPLYMSAHSAYDMFSLYKFMIVN